jgi:hypothetical protein
MSVDFQQTTLRYTLEDRTRMVWWRDSIWFNWWSFMNDIVDTTPLKVISLLYVIISYHQYQYRGRSNFWGGSNIDET